MAKKAVKAKSPAKKPMLVFDHEKNKLLGLPYKEGAINAKSVCMLLKTVDAGLIGGSEGDPKPGQMCIEAAVAYALGHKFNDRPKCVNYSLAGFKIQINDDWPWANDKERARGLRRLGVAQLGTRNTKFNYDKFKTEVLGLWQARFVNLPFVKATKADLAALKQAVSKKDVLQFAKQMDVIFGNDSPTEHVSSIAATDLSDPEDYISELPDRIQRKLMFDMCEDAVQVLKRMKTPGSKFLYLTERKLKK